MKPITIATLPEASAQEVFDWIVFNLLAQNHRSIGPVDTGGRSEILTCVYRSPEGYKCAAGWLIGDDEYNSSMENMTWDCMYAEGRVPDVHRSLIAKAQNIHDTAIPEEWPGKFAALGVEYGLNLAVVDNHPGSGL